MIFHASAAAASRDVERSGTANDAWSRAGFWLLACLALYFGLHVLTRSLVSNSLQLDEAEQLILTQDWRWGYGSQPPLYNWLQKILFSIFGLNVFALSLLKNCVLWSIYFFVYRSALEIFSQPKPAVIATASVLLMPHIVWESQRDQTHLLLATSCAAATLFVFVRVLKRQSPGDYAALGLLAGLGLLSKYNYLFLPLSLMLAAISLPRFRSAVLNPKLLLTFAVLLAVSAPHLFWAVEHQASAASQSYKFEMAASGGGIAPYLKGVQNLLQAIVSFTVVPLLIYSWALYRAFRSGPSKSSGDERAFANLILRTFLFGLLLMLIVTLVFRVTFIRDRWLQPLLFAVPILLVAWTRPQLGSLEVKAVLGLAAVAAFAVLIAINGTVLGANRLGRAHNLNVPFAAMADELRRAGFERGTIVADGPFVGGNLKMQFQESRVIAPGTPFDPPIPGEPVLVVWRNSAEPPDELLDFAQQVLERPPDPAQTRRIEIPIRNGDRRRERLGFLLVAADVRKL